MMNTSDPNDIRIPSGQEPGGIEFGTPIKGNFAPKRKIREVMTSEVVTITPNTPIEVAAKKMRDLNVGILPICEGERLLGAITDRDITIRIVAEGLDLKKTNVRTGMSTPVVYCFEDQDIDEVVRIMEVRQVRRLIILNRDKKLSGIVSLGDLAVKAQRGALTEEVLEEISKTIVPPRIAKGA